MTQSLNLLKSNNIDTNKWIQNLQPVLLQKESDTNKTIFPKWNGSQPIDTYISSFEEQCKILQIPDELKPVILTQHLSSHKQAFNIANGNLCNFEKLKSKLVSRIRDEEKTKEKQSEVETNKDSHESKVNSTDSNESKVISTDSHESKVISTDSHESKVINKNCHESTSNKDSQESNLNNNCSNEQKRKVIDFCNITSEIKQSNESFNKIDHDTLLQEQNKDKYIIKLLQSIKNPKSYNSDKFTIQNKILIRLYETTTGVQQQIVVPMSLTQVVISSGHDNPLAGHLGTKKTYQNLLQHFWWKSMKKDIKKYIESCNECQRKNKIHAKHIAPVQKVEKIVTPFYKVAIDIIGPMTTTRNSKSKFALVVIDMATRWLEVVPLREITSERICNALLSIFSRFGFPNIVLSDNGTQFVSNLTTAFNQMLQITQIFSTRYHPQSNGCVERANQTIKLMIEKVCIDKPKDWDI
jgi:Integrase zinc binding domain/Integrase core domain